MVVINKIKKTAIELFYKAAYLINPRLASDVMYYHAFHKWQNLKNPKNLIEKINWLQFNSDTSMWTLCADKYRMREYVAQCGFDIFLPKLYGHWSNPEHIDFASLPGEFVLKSNNGCGTVMIIRDKSNLNLPSTLKVLKSWIKPYGYVGGQSHYLRINPCIIAEELLHQSGENEKINSSSLTDYKVWCFHGEPECVLVIHNRCGTSYLMDIYDTSWERVPNSLKDNAHNGVTEEKVPKPVCLGQMLDIARKLSAPFVEVRTDFYIIDNKPIIGELTFTSGYGNYTESFYNYLGTKINLQKVHKTV